MSTGLVYHPDYLKHNLKMHPENANRLKNIVRFLEEEGMLEQLIRVPPRPATREELGYVHDASYIEEIERRSREGSGLLDADTYLNSASFRVALLGAGGVLSATEAVLEKKVDNVLALIRPPGHHAYGNHGGGFCLFNNVALGVRYSQKKYNLKKVLIIDWDVHHGNGTQDIFYEDNSVLYVSLHQFPFYPGTGGQEEQGQGEGEGYTLNIPLEAGSSGEDYLKAFREALLPRVETFNPEMIFISAGFDAHRADPLGGMNLTEEDFGKMTELTKNLAERFCQGRIVSVLEGGYNPEALSDSIQRHLLALKGEGN